VITLIDTGCNITAIERSLVLDIETKTGNTITIGKLDKPVSLTTASAQALIPCGKVLLSFLFGERVLSQNFFVFEKLPFAVILGMDFMRDRQLSIHLEANKIDLQIPQASTDILGVPSSQQVHELHTVRQEDFEPLQGRWIEVKASVSEPITSKFAIVKSDEMQGKSVCMMNGLIDVNKVLSVFATNASTRPVSVRAGAAFGWIEPLHPDCDPNSCTSLIAEIKAMKKQLAD
jgi:hypothetical protein